MNSIPDQIVDFFITGVQKGGTTALDMHLRRCPGIQMARTKEIHYFDNEGLNWSAPAREPLHECFDWSAGRLLLRGEATPIYSYWPHALERLHHYNPSAKLIMCLRHPAYRAHSHWRMETRRGLDSLPFAAVISETGRSRVSSAPLGVHRIFSYVERGFYSAQIKRMQSLFPDNQIHFLRTDDLWSQSDHTLHRLLTFLGAATSGEPGPPRMVPPRPAGPPPESSRTPSAEIAELTSLYAEDIRLSESLTGMPLADWLDEDYREPMADAA